MISTSNNRATTTSNSSPFFQWILVGGVVIIVVVLLQWFLAQTSLIATAAAPSHHHSNHHHHSDIISGAREQQRRLQHAMTGSVLVIVSYFIPVHLSVVLLWLGALGIVYVKSCHVSWYQQAFGPLLRRSEQQQQQQQLPGAFYFLVGVACTVMLVPMPVARYATLCLSWADPMAAWAGQREQEWIHHSIIIRGRGEGLHHQEGQHQQIKPSSPSSLSLMHRILSYQLHSHASVAGCMACFVTAFLIGCVGDGLFGLLFHTNNNTLSSSSLILSQQIHWWFMLRYMCGAWACTLAEASPYGNDNLLIPIATALAVSLYDAATTSNNKGM